MRMFRKGLVYGNCSSALSNNSLDWRQFHYMPNVKNITILYNCPNDIKFLNGTKTSVNSFSCKEDEKKPVFYADSAIAEGKGLTDFSSFVSNGSAFGIALRKSCFIASLAQFVAGLGMPSGSNAIENRYSTFLQLVCQLPRGTKLSVLGNHHLPLLSKQFRKLGSFIIPLVLSDQHEASEIEPEASPFTRTQVSGGSPPIMLESELGGWVEMNSLNPKL